MTSTPKVTRIGDRAYRVEVEGRTAVVYVADSERGRWAFCLGEVFLEEMAAESGGARLSRRDAHETLTAPMPAKIVNVAVAPGAAVKKGDTLLVLEAMKMEMPIRASGHAIVKAVHCREGELVQPETVLIELEQEASS